MALKTIIKGFQTTTSTGSALTMEAVSDGFVAFGSELIAADTFYGMLSAADGEWEYGIFTMTSLSPDVITRPATPIASSNAGASITLSAGRHSLRGIEPVNAKLGSNSDGTLNLHDAIVLNSFQNCRNSDINTTTTKNLDLALSHAFMLYLAADVTLTVSNLPAKFSGTGYKFMELTIFIEQNFTGGWTVTFPANFYPSGTQPDINATPYTTAEGFYVIKAILNPRGATESWIWWVC